MDDPNAHEDDDLEKDTPLDDPIETPADTNPNGEDDPKKKADAEEVAKKQEDSWLDDINSGKKSLDDMPENLGWLKKRVKAKLPEDKPEKVEKKEEKVDIRSEIRAVNAEERAQDEFGAFIKTLKEANISNEKDADLREEYQDQLQGVDDPSVAQQLKALKTACRLVGLKDVISSASERRRKGMELPPFGGSKRKTVKSDKKTEMEEKFSKDLPPGFKTKK